MSGDEVKIVGQRNAVTEKQLPESLVLFLDDIAGLDCLGALLLVQHHLVLECLDVNFFALPMRSA